MNLSISNFIYSWLKDITILFIIISLIDLIMPKGSMKRYINFVIGLLIIFTVINPFINLSKIKFNLDKEVFNNLYKTSPEYMEKLIKSQDSKIEELYTEKISEEIGQVLKRYTNHNILDITIDIEKNDGVYGTINNIDIVLVENEIENQEKNINIKIKPVSLNKSKENSDSLDGFDELKRRLAEELSIDEKLINIILKKPGG